jgi:hypothetical protein
MATRWIFPHTRGLSSRPRYGTDHHGDIDDLNAATEVIIHQEGTT